MQTHHVITFDGKLSYQHPFRYISNAFAFARHAQKTFKNRLAIHTQKAEKGFPCCRTLGQDNELQECAFCLVHQDLQPVIDEEAKDLEKLYNGLTFNEKERLQ